MVLRRLATLGLLATLAGCSPISPSGQPATGPTATGQSSPVATAPIASSGTIDQQFTTPALEFRSTGTHLIWSTGARADHAADVAPDLFASEPGGTPQLIYDNPNRDSRLDYLDGSGTRVAFIEINPARFGAGAWKLWYMASLDAKPTLVDDGSSDALPFFTISQDHLVWATVEGARTKSELIDLDLGSMERRTLASAEPGKTQFWFPDIDGERVVYGTVEPQTDGSEDQRHIYLLDLKGSGPAKRLDQGMSASEPAIHGNDIVWKESDLRLNFLGPGKLVRYHVDSGTQAALALPTEGDLGFVEPTVGNRFATAWPQANRMLYLADLKDGTYPPIQDLGPTNDDPHDALALPDISGDLLAYVFAPKAGDLELRWVLLQP